MAHGGQSQAHDAPVGWVDPALHQPGLHGPVDEAHHAVVAQEQVRGDLADDVLGTTRVRAVMTAPVETVHDRDTVATVASRFKFDGHGAYPIVDDDGRCVGIVARGDLLRLGWGDEEILGEVALGEVVSVSPDDLVIDALRLILEEQIDHVPVIAGDRLLGICTRTDILRARREQFAHEKPQPGWRPVRRRRSA